MTKNMKILEKAIKYLKENTPKNNGLFCYELVYEALDSAISEAKKEVFDDIWNTWAKKYGDNHTSSEAIFDMHNMLRDLEKRHLSTSKKEAT